MKAKVASKSVIDRLISLGNKFGISVETDQSRQLDSGFTTAYFWTGNGEYDRVTVVHVFSGEADRREIGIKEIKACINNGPDSKLMKAYGVKNKTDIVVYRGANGEVDIYSRFKLKKKSVSLLNESIALKVIAKYMIGVGYNEEH